MAPDLAGPRTASPMAGTPGVPSAYGVSTVIEVDLAHGLPDLVGSDGTAFLVLVRLCGDPVGLVTVGAGTSAASLASEIDGALGALLRDARRSHGLDPDGTLTAAGLPHDACTERSALHVAAVSGPPISVLLCTRDRAEALRTCLSSLVGLNYHTFEVVVVDNAPSDNSTESVCADFVDVLPLTYVVEPAPGLSRARNTALRRARHDVVAFLDDDERVDPLWLAAIGQEFAADPTLGALSGLVLPAELRTTAQAQFEQFGGHSKGRGFRRVLFDGHYRATTQSALYPLPPFGVGANMAFRREALRDAGDFDVALGAGSPAHGAEDTAAFTEVMLAGWTMVYAPRAVTWHYHRDDARALARQLSGYGVGLGAYYTSVVVRDPRRVVALARLLPLAYRDFTSDDGLRRQSHDQLPPGLANGNVAAILRGPVRYLRGRVTVRPTRRRGRTS